jgi:hypothetical protein
MQWFNVPLKPSRIGFSTGFNTMTQAFLTFSAEELGEWDMVALLAIIPTTMAPEHSTSSTPMRCQHSLC